MPKSKRSNSRPRPGRFRLPKLTTRKYWVGAYGGHFDIVVVFFRKPACFEEFQGHHRGEALEGQAVDMLAEQAKENIAADLPLFMFQALFPRVDLSPILHQERPTAIEVVKQDLLRVELQAPVDMQDPAPHRRWLSLDFHVDW
jgi:hypothetical protein